MLASRPDKPDLSDASDTDEVYRLAYELAAWGLRNGECDEFDAVDWVLGHPHESSLPRGSSGRPNATEHHITSGAKAAAESYVPGVRAKEFDPDPLHELAARIAGSGVTHERYLLGAIALCHKFETLTPVITGPLLAGAVGVADPVAGRVLSEWSTTMAGGFFSGVTYDGVQGHGRVWAVDVEWTPEAKPKHLPGCNRSRARCRCPGLAEGCRKTGDLSLTAAKDRSPKLRHTRRDITAEFAQWLATLERRAPLTVTGVAKQLAISRAAATKLLRAQQGELLDEFTYPGGQKRRRQADGTYAWTKQGETWFVGQP
ncbi:hypothetical protein [Mycolicibacterium helvum]|uniref:Uncharacterized protein n=1 Tax=Mycolicibacterium helvum TaxID=1534349 RepID=A0A7I7SYU6_9MYCO|nr:hypothetical protein [Mycolicibacterium helvum]BBY62192.1 hypothetical protein MHEL_04350 [Mycolicibacterium helvum]